jgi:hypothetical protein
MTTSLICPLCQRPATTILPEEWPHRWLICGRCYVAGLKARMESTRRYLERLRGESNG